MKVRRTVELLLVEDMPGDVMLIQKALMEMQIRARLSVVEDGEQAVAYLLKQGQYVNAVTPDLIILDLNLPKKSGHEVLREIRNFEDLRQVPVVVLSESASNADIEKTYDLGATCFITKPFGFYRFLEAVKMIVNFWLNLVTSPPAREKPSYQSN